MKVITFNEIKKLNISPFECYNWVSEIIKNKSLTQLPPKISLHPYDGVFCNFMPCIVPFDDKLYGGVKVVNRYPERLPSLDSQLQLIDMTTGDFLALMDANWITAMRTGAVAVHSINLFAKKNFSTLGVMGLGNTARATLLVLASVYPDREFNIKVLKYKNQAENFISRFSEYTNFNFTVVESYNELIKGSEVVVSCVTYFAEDICDNSVFDEGVLIVPVHTRGFTNCDLFFDKVYADDTGHVSNFRNFAKFKSFAEVTDVVNNRVPGRESDKERILAYNIGLAIHDIYFASKIYNKIDSSNLLDINLNSPTEKFWI